MATKKKKQWGGKRSGSGRPQGKNTVVVNFCVHKDLKEEAKKVLGEALAKLKAARMPQVAAAPKSKPVRKSAAKKIKPEMAAKLPIMTPQMKEVINATTRVSSAHYETDLSKNKTQPTRSGNFRKPYMSDAIKKKLGR